MTKLLKRADRTLLEMHTGMLLFGLACQVVGCFAVQDQARYAGSLWMGILLAGAASIHMGRTLDRALETGANTSKILSMGYLIRYFLLAAILAATALTGVLSTLVVFLGYMSLKVTAYMQPLTHKFYNMLFQESDPVPCALPEEGDDVRAEVPSEEAAAEDLSSVQTQKI